MSILIIGSNKCESAKEMIKNMYKDKPHEIIIDCIHDNTENTKYNIAIVLGNMKLSDKKFNLLRSSDYILINSDIKDINKMIRPNNAKNIITFGFNSKATVTASSVSDDEYKKVAFCIQREVPTFSNKILVQQEFSVKAKVLNTDVYSLLASVTAVLLDDFEVEKLNDIM